MEKCRGDELLDILEPVEDLQDIDSPLLSVFQRSLFAIINGKTTSKTASSTKAEGLSGNVRYVSKKKGRGA